MGSAEFEYFCGQAQEKAGIALSHHKWGLVQSRLRARLAALGLEGFSEYRAHLERLPPDHPEWQEFINELTTNKTDWFREPAHFESLVNDFLPRWKAFGRKRLSVWCAASSTGQEPYTLAMILAAHLDRAYELEILASDIDTRVLQVAANGVYPRETVQAQVPSPYLESAFARGTGEIADWVKVRDRLRSKVRFERINLTSIPPDLAGTQGQPFDLVFCRNVFIYFDSQTIESIVSGFSRLATPDAALYLSHSESLQRVRSDWALETPSIYRNRRRARG